MNVIHNERAKYLATLVNTAAATSIAAGVIAPLVALTYRVPGPIAGVTAVLVSVVWLFVGVSLHLVVYVLLGRLRT